MATRNGKVANLPNEIREQLNLRLLEGESARELAAWLNALPAVQSVLASQFNDSPISEVNLTHWRQGGYLQWLTERECFDSARALADGDDNLAASGISAQRLLNILTVRFGQILLYWDTSPDTDVFETAAFNQIAKKARILQGISRSLLAIHRIQSRSSREKSGPAISSAANPDRALNVNAPVASARHPSSEVNDPETKSASPSNRLSPENRPLARNSMRPLNPLTLPTFRAQSSLAGERPKILSGRVSSAGISLKLPHTPFDAGSELTEILNSHARP